MVIQEIKFNFEGYKLRGAIFSPDKTPSPGVLFFLGGGKSLSIEYFEKWQKYFLKNGISSFSFEYRGLGKSSGNFEDGTLNNRLSDGVNAFKVFIDSGVVDLGQVCALGNSMGAHVASRLTDIENISCLILNNPAAYSKKSENKPLNKEFTQEITKKDSWKNSPVFEMLKEQQIPSLVMSAEQDEIVPQEVVDKYASSLTVEKHVIKGVPHRFLDKNDHASIKAQRRVFELSTAFLKDNFEL